MREFKKVIVGIGRDKIQSYAKRGDILIPASSTDKMKGRLPKEHHFFVSINDRMPSRYGVIKELKGTITPLDLAVLNAKSKGLKDDTFNEEELLEFERFLEKISKFPVNTPMGTTWLYKVITQVNELRVHKIFFTGITDEIKRDYFDFEVDE